MAFKLRREEYSRVSSFDGVTLTCHVNVISCCGSEIYCYNFTNTCDNCHADYNSAGQELADRSFWGRGNGETSSDILRVK